MIIAQIVMFAFILVFCCIHGGSVTQNPKPEIQATIISKKILLQMWILFCTAGLHLWVGFMNWCSSFLLYLMNIFLHFPFQTITLALFIRIVVLTKELTWQLDPIVVEKVSSLTNDLERCLSIPSCSPWRTTFSFSLCSLCLSDHHPEMLLWFVAFFS